MADLEDFIKANADAGGNCWKMGQKKIQKKVIRGGRGAGDTGSFQRTNTIGICVRLDDNSRRQPAAQ